MHIRLFVWYMLGAPHDPKVETLWGSWGYSEAHRKTGSVGKLKGAVRI